MADAIRISGANRYFFDIIKEFKRVPMPEIKYLENVNEL
jgi:hypothetical protein